MSVNANSCMWQLAQAWLPRRHLGGTYDQTWLENTHPNWPRDYDFEYHNASNPRLRARAFLGERLKFEFVGLHPEKRHWVIEYNAPTVAAVFETQDSHSPTKLNADSFHFDLNFEEHRDPRLFVNLRAAFDAYRTDLIELSELSDDDLHQHEDEREPLDLIDAPFPEQVAVPPYKLDPDYEEEV